MKSLVPLGSTFSLIKAGAFDKIEENKSRYDVMIDYLHMNFPDKQTLDLRGVENASELGIVPTKLELAVRINNFKNYICRKENFIKQDEEKKSKKWYIVKGTNDRTTEQTVNFFNEHFLCNMEEGKDYYFDELGNTIFSCKLKSTAFEKTFDELTQKLKEWLKSKDCLDRLNEYSFNEKIEKYAKGSISKWEMDSLSYYYHEHELAHIDKDKYCIEDYKSLDEKPKVVGYSNYKGIEYPKYELHRIAGTVLDKDKNKHTVSLLTIGGEVVLLKYYSGQFTFYDRTISEQHSDGTKTKLEDSWFGRGNLISVVGYRQGDQFKCKKYFDSIFQHSTELINRVYENGDITTQTERIKV